MSTEGIMKKTTINGGSGGMEDVSEITKKIEMALEANLKTQHEIVKRLSSIASLKRKLSVTLRCEESVPQECNGKNDRVGDNKSPSDRPEKKRKTMSSSSSVKKTARGWNMNEGRKWTRRFFLDPNLSTPVPNADTMKRRKWEGCLNGMYKTRYTPWTKGDVDILTESVNYVKQQHSPNSGGDSDEFNSQDVEIDFQKVFEKIKDELIKKRVNPSQMKKNENHLYSFGDDIPQNGTVRLRRWTDYRNKYLYSLSPSINKSPLSKKESSAILDILKKDQDNRELRWDEIARSLGNGRTTFQCFKYIQTKLSDVVGKLDATEDELLLKIVAAVGPQSVINHHTATSLSQRYFPHLSARQICLRLNTLLINPNYKNEKWTDFEERVLVLGMKVFSESTNPITKVAVSTTKCYLYTKF